MINKKRGQAFVWVFALAFLFMVGLIYIVMTKPFILVHDLLTPNLTGTEFEPTIDKIVTFWRVWPILVIVGIILWALLSSMRRDPNFPQL